MGLRSFVRGAINWCRGNKEERRPLKEAPNPAPDSEAAQSEPIPDAALPQNQIPPEKSLLGAQLALGAARDTFWTASSVQSWGLAGNQSTGAQWGNQCILGGSALLGMLFILLASRPEFRCKKGAALLGVLAVASLLAITPWNLGQDWGIESGQALGMNPTDAGFFAGIFTGVNEIATQYPVINVGGSIIDPATRANWRARFHRESQEQQSWGSYLKDIIRGSVKTAADIAWNVVPGAAWQWVFNAYMQYAPAFTATWYGTTVASLSVAVTVALASLLAAKTLVPATFKFIDVLFDCCCQPKQKTTPVDEARISAAAAIAATGFLATMREDPSTGEPALPPIHVVVNAA